MTNCALSSTTHVAAVHSFYQFICMVTCEQTVLNMSKKDCLHPQSWPPGQQKPKNIFKAVWANQHYINYQGGGTGKFGLACSIPYPIALTVLTGGFLSSSLRPRLLGLKPLKSHCAIIPFTPHRCGNTSFRQPIALSCHGQRERKSTQENYIGRDQSYWMHESTQKIK